MNLFKLLGIKDINREVDVYRNTPNAVLLDVRSETEFAEGHIPGAVNLPLDRITGVGQLPADHNTPVFIYCLRGTRSLRAAGIMRKLGYKNVRSIGGITAYKGKLE